MDADAFMLGILLSFVRHRTIRRWLNDMSSSEQIIRELESKRKALNERLMNAKDLTEANSIERELWALRAAIRHHKGTIVNRTSRKRKPQVGSERTEF